MAGSQNDWPTPPAPPSGAPNIVFVLVDDVGFSDIGCFGSEINTPHIDRLAAEGVRFTNFHVNPMCSPTRASLLTGLNAHAAGMGHIAQDDPGFPGYRAEIASNVATAAEILRGAGYATLMVGKWHLCRDADMSSGGPQHGWPCQRGFDRYYGILEAFTNLHQPHRLVEDNHVVEIDQYPDDYFLTDDLTEKAIRMIRDRAASRPGQPFFLYMAHPAAHAPLVAKPVDVERYRDAYTQGWDEIRISRHARQLELGIIPPGTPLPPRNSEPGDDVHAWDDLTDDERTVYARYMAVYAAMVDEIDQSVGRLREALVEMGEWENTILVFLSDNGASREGESTGTTNYFGHLGFGDALDRLPKDLARLDDIGGPQTMTHYPRGWAMASNTPFRLYKRNTHAGGHQVPCVWSWPKGLTSVAGEIRTQYGHCIDVLPTVLAMAGIDTPAERNGEPLKPMNGASMVGVLHDAHHGEVREEQYYEMEGHRGFYRDGWEVVTNRKPRTKFTDADWELYDLRTDPVEVSNLAAEQPERVAELSAGFHTAAVANQVYPLDEGSGWRWLARPPKDDVFHQPVTIWPGTPTLERIRSGSLVWQRTCVVAIDVAHAAGDEGVLVSHGDQGGGYALEVEGDELWFVHNDGHGTTLRTSAGALAAGRHDVVLTLGGPGGGRWIVTLAVDGVERFADVERPMLWPMAPFTGISIGIDRGSPVDWQRYGRRGAFAYAGTVRSVRYEPGELAPDAGARFVEFVHGLGARYE
ncbi:MAG: arylsulfatase family protein [Ilumatobacteraceae bacterium]|nr:arylsulfatase family protein [Ilumatobacteraceae bacterium]